MSETNYKPLLLVIIVIGTMNLFMTGAVWLSQTPFTSPPHVEQDPHVVDELPDYLDTDERKRLADRMQALFNQGDASVIYAAFDELVKIKLSLEDVSESLEQMTVIGQIESSVYTHHESSKYGDFPVYVLYYNVRLSGGPFQSGVLKISVIDRGGTYSILAFNVFGGAQSK